MTYRITRQKWHIFPHFFLEKPKIANIWPKMFTSGIPEIQFQNQSYQICTFYVKKLAILAFPNFFCQISTKTKLWHSGHLGHACLGKIHNQTKIGNFTIFFRFPLKKIQLVLNNVLPSDNSISFFPTDHSRRHGKTASTNTTSRSSSGGRSQKGGTLMHSASCPFKVNLSLWPSISSSICLSSVYTYMFSVGYTIICDVC